MNKTAVSALALFLTGPEVCHAAMSLRLDGPSSPRAARFFALRDALGVTGYMSVAEAQVSIAEALEKPE